MQIAVWAMVDYGGLSYDGDCCYEGMPFEVATCVPGDEMDVKTRVDHTAMSQCLMPMFPMAIIINPGV